MDEANMSNYRAILSEIKQVIDTKDYCYQMKLERNINVSWELRGYSDTDYTGCNDIQKSAT